MDDRAVRREELKVWSLERGGRTQDLFSYRFFNFSIYNKIISERSMQKKYAFRNKKEPGRGSKTKVCPINDGICLTKDRNINAY